jgi:hypothetical protein
VADVFLLIRYCHGNVFGTFFGGSFLAKLILMKFNEVKHYKGAIEKNLCIKGGGIRTIVTNITHRRELKTQYFEAFIIISA